MGLFRCLKEPFREAHEHLMIAPRELRVLMVIVFFLAFGSAGASAITVSYLSDEFGASDTSASTMFAMAGVSFLIMSLFTGRIIDIIGIKKSLILSSLFATAGSVILSVAQSVEMVVFAIVIVVPLTASFSSPIFTIAIQRYTYEKNSRVAFMFAYLILNVGASLSYLFVDYVRYRFGSSNDIIVYREYSATSSRVIFLTGSLAAMLAAVVACALRDVTVDENGLIGIAVTESGAQRLSSSTTPAGEATARLPSWLGTFCEANFIRMALFSAIMFPLLKMFTHWDITFPKAAVRELGDDALFGTIKAVNPIVITLLQLPISHAFRNFNIYSVLIIGSTISALSVFILCAPMTYASAVSAVAFFTVGEMVFSHRVQDFMRMFMPKDRAGVYSTLSGIYLVVPRFVVDAMSGYLLSAFCPASGPKNCQIMWALIGLMGCATPLLLLPFRKYLLSGVPMSGKGDVELAPASIFTISDPPHSKEDNDNDY
jgi:MFS family permease